MRNSRLHFKWFSREELPLWHCCWGSVWRYRCSTTSTTVVGKRKCRFSILTTGIFQLFLHVLPQRLPENILQCKPKHATHPLHSSSPTVSTEVCIRHYRKIGKCNSWWPEAWEGASGALLQHVKMCPSALDPPMLLAELMLWEINTISHNITSQTSLLLSFK